MLSRLVQRLMLIALLAPLCRHQPARQLRSALLTRQRRLVKRTLDPRRGHCPLPVTARPQIALDLQIAPDPLTFTATATLTATVVNSGDATADNLAVRIPFPDGVQALTGPVTTNGPAAWEWQLGSRRVTARRPLPRPCS